MNAVRQIPANTWWFTGLPAAGKTTLAQALAERLRALGQAACILDGDRIRQGLNANLGFSVADREENMRRVAEIASLLNESGIHALVALVSPTCAGRANARQIIGENFIEVHVATPLPICQQRDPKGLYARALAKPGSGLTGVDAPFEIPEAPEIVIDTSITRTDEAVSRLLNFTRT